jgi:hypothetical protein
MIVAKEWHHYIVFPLFLWWLHKLTPQLLPTLFLFELNASTLYLDLFKRNPYYSGVVLY